MTANPLLFIAVSLTLGVILVNGWTDAPIAIATCVVTRCMPPKAAILMAALFNFLGVFVMTLLYATVAETITKMVDFGADPDLAIIALSEALFAIVLWATLACNDKCRHNNPPFCLLNFSFLEKHNRQIPGKNIYADTDESNQR